MSEKVEIKAMENGPLLISGQATVTDTDGNVSETQGSMVALCRCGQSANKPFCDGSHKNAGFEASETLITLQSV
ncbi:MAG: CDGSH iron-sulfur domain-containing protein [Chloroflexi bacterium]|nr:CDGSH iron-sulfur domain-containing protein [Chloroflexota bacterium]